MILFSLLFVLNCVTDGALAQTENEPLLGLKRGGNQASLQLRVKRSNSYRDAYGWRTPYSDGTVFSHTQLSASVSHGLSASTTLYLHVPFVLSDLRSAQGEHARIAALGDVYSGLIYRLLASEAAETALQLELKSPSGMEWPGPEHSLLTGTGTTNLALYVLEATRPLPGLSVDAQVGYVLKFPAIVGYVTEIDGYGHGWIDPGDEIQTQLELGFQLTPSLSAHLGTQFSQHMFTTTGSSTPGPSGLSLWWVPGTGGTYLDASAGLSLAVEHWQLQLDVGRDVVGPDSRVFSVLGLEELSPQPGWTANLGATRRW